jgi:hypothetical protein
VSIGAVNNAIGSLHPFVTTIVPFTLVTSPAVSASIFVIFSEMQLGRAMD